MTQTAATYSVREFLNNDALSLSAIAAEVITDVLVGGIQVEGGITLSDGSHTAYFDHSVIAFVIDADQRLEARLLILTALAQSQALVDSVIAYHKALEDAFDEALSEIDRLDEQALVAVLS